MRLTQGAIVLALFASAGAVRNIGSGSDGAVIQELADGSTVSYRPGLGWMFSWFWASSSDITENGSKHQQTLMHLSKILLQGVSPLANSTSKSALYRAAGVHRDNLIRAVKAKESDVLPLVRMFLQTIERHASTFGAHSHLVFLLRTLQEQKQSCSPASFVHEAMVVNTYEDRVKHLEAKDVYSVAQDVMETEELQHRIEKLLGDLKQAEGDHAMMFNDGGVLFAFWLGRVERVSRVLEDYTMKRQPRKTVLVWTCSYGGGHWVAAKAVKSYLSEYNVIIADASKDKLFYEDDTVGNWIRDNVYPEWDMTYPYNQIIMRHRLYHTENLWEKLEVLRGWLFRGDGTRFAIPCSAPYCDSSIKKLMRRALLRAAPDFTITVYHMDLLPIIELCAEQGNLPIIHLATDMDAKMSEVFRSAPLYPHVRVGLPYPIKEIHPTIAPVHLSQTFLSGYPVRKPFLEPILSHQGFLNERSKRGIPIDAKVALVMSGRVGQPVQWPAMLLNSATWQGQKLHVILVAGGDYEFAKALQEDFTACNTIQRHLILCGSNTNVTLEVAKDPLAVKKDKISYNIQASELARLMDISDIIISKPGGGTTAEAAYRGVPMLFDATDGLLRWEAFTAQVFERHHRGKILYYAYELEHDILEVLAMDRSQNLVRNGDTQLQSPELLRQAMQSLLVQASEEPLTLPS